MLLIFASGGSTPREDHIALINEQLLNQGFAAVKRPDRKPPGAKHVVDVGTVALAVNRMSLLESDAAVESKADWTDIRPLNCSACHYFHSSGRQEILTSSNIDRQWNSRAVCLDSASLSNIP
jgi:hypothetical protein